VSRLVDLALGRCTSDGRWETDFGRWVADYGPSEIVERFREDPELRITQHAVYEWLRGHVPRVERAMALVELSAGHLTLEQIYAHGNQVKVMSDGPDHSER